MGDQIAGFTLLGSAIAVIFGVLRYRQVRAATRAAAQDRLMQWAAEMEQHAASAPAAGAEPGDPDGVARGNSPTGPSVAAPAMTPVDVAASESDADSLLDTADGDSTEDDTTASPVADVRAEMDAFFAGHTPLPQSSDRLTEKHPTA